MNPCSDEFMHIKYEAGIRNWFYMGALIHKPMMSSLSNLSGYEDVIKYFMNGR